MRNLHSWWPMLYVMRGDVEVDLALGGDVVDVAVVHPSPYCSTSAGCLMCESDFKSGS